MFKLFTFLFLVVVVETVNAREIGYRAQIAWGSADRPLEWQYIPIVRGEFFEERSIKHDYSVRVLDEPRVIYWVGRAVHYTPEIPRMVCIVIRITGIEGIFGCSWLGLCRIKVQGKLDKVIYAWSPPSPWLLLLDPKKLTIERPRRP